MKYNLSDCNKYVFFFKQKTAYEIRPRDWSSDVCSSDLVAQDGGTGGRTRPAAADENPLRPTRGRRAAVRAESAGRNLHKTGWTRQSHRRFFCADVAGQFLQAKGRRSEDTVFGLAVY